MSVQKFITSFNEQFKDVPSQYSTWMDDYLNKEKDEYKQNKDSGKLTFGKYKGYSIVNLSKDEKGKSYLQWLIHQSFFTKDKFGYLIDAINEAGIKKN